MSLFQCEKCGCMDNTACGGTGNLYYMYSQEKYEKHPAMEYYRKVLELKPEDDFPKLCVVCNPVWFTEKGEYGIGPIPEGYRDGSDTPGRWHNKFDRIFLPLGEFETNRVGNLAKKSNGDENIRKYAIRIDSRVEDDSVV